MPGIDPSNITANNIAGLSKFDSRSNLMHNFKLTQTHNEIGNHYEGFAHLYANQFIEDTSSFVDDCNLPFDVPTWDYTNSDFNKDSYYTVTAASLTEIDGHDNDPSFNYDHETGALNIVGDLNEYEIMPEEYVSYYNDYQHSLSPTKAPLSSFIPRLALYYTGVKPLTHDSNHNFVIDYSNFDASKWVVTLENYNELINYYNIQPSNISIRMVNKMHSNSNSGDRGDYIKTYNKADHIRSKGSKSGFRLVSENEDNSFHFSRVSYSSSYVDSTINGTECKGLKIPNFIETCKNKSTNYYTNTDGKGRYVYIQNALDNEEFEYYNWFGIIIFDNSLTDGNTTAGIEGASKISCNSIILNRYLNCRNDSNNKLYVELMPGWTYRGPRYLKQEEE